MSEESSDHRLWQILAAGVTKSGVATVCPDPVLFKAAESALKDATHGVSPASFLKFFSELKERTRSMNSVLDTRLDLSKVSLENVLLRRVSTSGALGSLLIVARRPGTATPR